MKTKFFIPKVTQIACDSPIRAPQGCTQYYYGSDTNSARSYNYNSGNGYHLANQNQKICVRRERNNCKICWYHASNDFNLSGINNSQGKIATCCGYGQDGKKSNKDCLVIPSASKTDGALIAAVKGFCGNRLVTADAGTADKTICCKYEFHYAPETFKM